MRWSWPRLLSLSLLPACASAGGVGPGAAAPAEGGYVAYVASEAVDEVSRIRFVPGQGARVEARHRVGTNPVENEGPHGLAFSPDGRYYYVSIAHGTPYGALWKVVSETGAVVGRTPLGLFPATVGVTPDGAYAFVSNFNLHGDPVPSSVSKVHLPSMTEVARTQTCIMPHGSRINPQGTKQYSTCMMDQKLVEIDVATGEVSRVFSVAPGREGAVRPGGEHAGHAGAATVCSPTWAQPSADGARVYVACNRLGEVLEIDARSWSLTRRFPTGESPYNLEVTPDGRYLLVTLKNRSAPATEVIDLSEGRTVARIPSTAILPHGVAVSADSRYAFVSAEGVGSEPGKVDVIDLSSLQRVASVAVGQQAGGIAVMGGAGR